MIVVTAETGEKGTRIVFKDGKDVLDPAIGSVAKLVAVFIRRMQARAACQDISVGQKDLCVVHDAAMDAREILEVARSAADSLSMQNVMVLGYNL